VAAIAFVITLMLLIVGAHAETCLASWYARGHRTANGERFRPDGLTAAHRTLPFGTRLRVRWHGRTVVVRVNDRGPARSTGRCIDLSRGSARALGMIGAGEGRVTIERLRGSK